VDLEEDEDVRIADAKADPNNQDAVGDGADMMDETAEEGIEKKQKLSIAYDEYMTLVKSLLAMMVDRQRRAEKKVSSTMGTETDAMDESTEENSSAAADGGEDDGALGMTVQEITEWYLNQIEHSIDSEEQYLDEMKKIRRVLKHMVKKVLVFLASRLVFYNAHRIIIWYH
jgi:hypothetical protein